MSAGVTWGLRRATECHGAPQWLGGGRGLGVKSVTQYSRRDTKYHKSPHGVGRTGGWVQEALLSVEGVAPSVTWRHMGWGGGGLGARSVTQYSRRGTECHKAPQGLGGMGSWVQEASHSI